MQRKGNCPLPLQPIPNNKTKTNTKNNANINTKTNNEAEAVYTERLTDPFRLPGDLLPLLVSPAYHLSVAACLVTAREISVFCHGLIGIGFGSRGLLS